MRVRERGGRFFRVWIYKHVLFLTGKQILHMVHKTFQNHFCRIFFYFEEV